MHGDNPLPPNYSVFGRTVAGQDVVDAIATTQTDPRDRPLADVTIMSITVTESPAA